MAQWVISPSGLPQRRWLKEEVRGSCRLAWGERAGEGDVRGGGGEGVRERQREGGRKKERNRVWVRVWVSERERESESESERRTPASAASRQQAGRHAINPFN